MSKVPDEDLQKQFKTWLEAPPKHVRAVVEVRPPHQVFFLAQPGAPVEPGQEEGLGWRVRIHHYDECPCLSPRGCHRCDNGVTLTIEISHELNAKLKRERTLSGIKPSELIPCRGPDLWENAPTV